MDYASISIYLLDTAARGHASWLWQGQGLMWLTGDVSSHPVIRKIRKIWREEEDPKDPKKWRESVAKMAGSKIQTQRTATHTGDFGAHDININMIRPPTT